MVAETEKNQTIIYSILFSNWSIVDNIATIQWTNDDFNLISLDWNSIFHHVKKKISMNFSFEQKKKS